MAQSSKPGLIKGMGMVASVALIVGNMVGTGIYTLPASLAITAGPISLISWGIVAVGFFFLALIYADLGQAYPRSGGPAVYARKAFGDFIGFEIAYSYWLSVIIGNAAIVIATVGYISVFNETMAASPTIQVVVALLITWVLVGVNIVGVRQGASVSIIATAAKLIPLFILAIVGIWYFEPENLTPFAPRGNGAILPAAALIVWAFAGLESATVPAEEVDDPRTIRRSTMIGFGLTALVYILISVTVMGLLPNETIGGSVGPLALAASQVLGPWGATLMAIGAMVAGIGTLNGWILLSGRIPLSVAADGLFPKVLAQIHPRFHTPHISLIISALIASAMILLRLSNSLLETFEFIVLLSVLMTLVPHMTSSLAEYVMSRREPNMFPHRSPATASAISIFGLAFVLWVIYGTGWESIGWGSILLVAGVLIYWGMKRG